jgi:hypothetical protein
MNFLLAIVLLVGAGPEVALREFSSSQIKKGVRVLGLGGDGATWGNYSLNYKDASTALVDYGGTFFSDTGNDIHFVAVGFTTPSFWRGAALYVIAMSEWASDLALHLKSPAFSRGADFRGEASDQAVFLKFAKLFAHDLSIGFLLGWERSALTAVNAAGNLSYTTPGLPSVGAGVTWDATPFLLLGFRFLLNNDWETRKDTISTASGWYHSWEWRLGLSMRVWRGGLFDVGYVGLWRGSAVDGTDKIEHGLVAGFEQELIPRHLTVRVGWNETSPTAGLSARVWRLKLDLAYVYKLGVDRTGGIFGKQDNSVLASLILDYARR